MSAPVSRQVMLHKSYFERFGYSANCSQCLALMRGEYAGPSHTVACRLRIEDEMAKDPILKIRLQIARERKVTYPASEVAQGTVPGVPVASQGEEPTPVQEIQRPDEDNRPEAIEEDGELVEDGWKRARVGSYNRTDEASGGVVE